MFNYPVMATIATTIAALTITTLICYRGAGDLSHRRRLNSMPWIWTVIFFFSGYSIGAECSLSYGELLLAILGSILSGAFFGWLMLERIGFDAVTRLDRKFGKLSF
jgi:hypothetical protein